MTYATTGGRPFASPVCPAVAPRQRLIGLDVLRALAVLLVLCGHEPFRMPEGSFGRGFFFAARQLGLVGVDMFFVLSGFLIGGMLLAELRSTNTIAFGRFLARRAWRLWPMYLLAVLFGWRWYHMVTATDEGVIVRGVGFAQMWPYFAHVQNYYNFADHNFGAGAMMQTWTMAALVQFYIIFGLLMVAIAAVTRTFKVRAVRCLPWLVAATFGLCFAARLHSAPVATYVYNPWLHYFPTHLRLDEPMFGVLLAYWVIHCRPQVDRFMRNAWWIVVLAGLVPLVPLAIREKEAARFVILWGYTLAGVGCGGIILCAWWWEQRIRQSETKPGLLRVIGRPLVHAVAWVGVWSYSIYLSHQPLVEWLALRVRNVIARRFIRWESPYLFFVVMLSYIAMAILLGAVVYWLIERPLLMLRGKVMTSEVPRLPVLKRVPRFRARVGRKALRTAKGVPVG